MIFVAEEVPLVLDGRKTMTRRLGKCRWRIGAVHRVTIGLYDKEPAGYIRIENRWLSPLGATTEEDAHREGYSSLASYKAAWERIHKQRWDDALETWVVTFYPYNGPPKERRKQETIDNLFTRLAATEEAP